MSEGADASPTDSTAFGFGESTRGSVDQSKGRNHDVTHLRRDGNATSVRQDPGDLHASDSDSGTDFLYEQQAVLAGAAHGAARAQAAQPPSPSLVLQREFDSFYDALPKVPKILASPLKSQE